MPKQITTAGVTKQKKQENHSGTLDYTALQRLQMGCPIRGGRGRLRLALALGSGVAGHLRLALAAGAGVAGYLRLALAPGVGVVGWQQDAGNASNARAQVRVVVQGTQTRKMNPREG